MSFVPNTPEKSVVVPFFDDVNSSDGWEGMTTTKSVERLKQEISVAIELLGGTVMSFQQGRFENRDGFRITYSLIINEQYSNGQLDIAALPVKKSYRSRRGTEEKRRDQSLRMALFMVRQALKGTWFLSKLSPGYAPLMPWMLASDGKTITQHWGEQMSNLLPAPTEDFVEGQVEE